jgi:arginyl-tRNA synthetase
MTGDGMPAKGGPAGRVNLRTALRGAFAAALGRLSADGITAIAADEIAGLIEQVRETADAKFGDYSGTMAMPLAKRAGKKPRDLALELAGRLETAPGYADLFAPPGQPVGPGFINVRVRDEALAGVVAAAVRDERMGVPPVERPRRIVIDYSSPNVAKPMHVGHIRSTVIGAALAKILAFRGHDVITVNHLGDWGTQFGMILWGYKRLRDQAAFDANPAAELGRLYRLVRKVAEAKPEELAADPEAARLAAAHPDAAREVLAETEKLHKGDAENLALWRQFEPFCHGEIDRIYRRLGVTFNHIMGESAYHPFLPGVVDDLVRRGLARETRGAVGIFARGEEAPPLLIRKADGAFLYATTDLAAIQWRLRQWQPDRILYVVDHRQGDHFEQVFATARKWGGGDPERMAGVELVHVAFGTVLGEDGRPFKTRAGDTVGLEALLDEGVERAARIVGTGDEARAGLDDAERRHVADTVGIGAIKYADLAQNRTTDYVFSFDKMLQLTGNTAAYMQYAVARVEGILTKGGVDRAALRADTRQVMLVDPRERALGLALARFAEVLEDVEADYRPNLLTTYLYDLAGRFSAFYDGLPVLKAEGAERASRLALCDLTGRVLRKGLELLGIGTVEKM